MIQLTRLRELLTAQEQRWVLAPAPSSPASPGHLSQGTGLRGSDPSSAPRPWEQPVTQGPRTT